MEKLTLQVSYLIPFKSCFKVFPVIKYTYVSCLKVPCRAFALCGLIVFMVQWARTYLEPSQISKDEVFAKIITSKEVTSLLRRLKRF